jgi:NADH/F420H2 dehydrogenase subunit C
VPETATSSPESRFASVAAKFPGEVTEILDYRDNVTLVVRPGRIREIIVFLKESPEHDFNVMMDLFGMDYLKFAAAQPERFAVIYNLYSLSRQARVFLKAFIPESEPAIDSIHDLYKAANWFEREAWDMYGIVFRGHPNLTRLLCHSDFVGHPLRKDYPADGYQRLKTAVPSNEL